MSQGSLIGHRCGRAQSHRGRLPNIRGTIFRGERIPFSLEPVLEQMLVSFCPVTLLSGFRKVIVGIWSKQNSRSRYGGTIETAISERKVSHIFTAATVGGLSRHGPDGATCTVYVFRLAVVQRPASNFSNDPLVRYRFLALSTFRIPSRRSS